MCRHPQADRRSLSCGCDAAFGRDDNVWIGLEIYALNVPCHSERVQERLVLLQGQRLIVVVGQVADDYIRLVDFDDLIAMIDNVAFAGDEDILAVK